VLDPRPDERDRHRMGAHAVARDAAGGVGGVEQRRDYYVMQLARRASLVFLVLLITPASWAAGGFYLLIPPEGEYDERAEFPNGYKILDSAPLSQWSLQGGYESASECVTSRSRYLIIEQALYSRSAEAYRKAIGAVTEPVVLKKQRLRTEKDSANVRAFMASLCVASDDARLR
jgi:hypothetical protein